MKPKNYYYDASIKMLESKPTIISPRHFDFESYEVPTLKIMSKNLADFRKVLGESQLSLSEKIGISRPQYRKYEQGVDVIRLDIAHRMSIKFGFPVFFLVSNSPYQALLNLPNRSLPFDTIWRYSNVLNDEYFLKLCKILHHYIGSENPINTSNLPGARGLNFELALKENREYSYIAISEGITAVRHYYELSQEEVAGYMGIALSTYREYEKPSQRPRFNLLTSIRWTASLGVHPFYALAGTELYKVRELQNQRIEVLMQLLCKLSEAQIKGLIPLVKGFYDAAAPVEGSLLLPTKL